MFDRRQVLALASAGVVLPSRIGSAEERRPISVIEPPFNAKGDGLSDDTAAIQAALNTGRDVFVPAAVAFYRITAQLELTRCGQCISGEGDRSRIVQHGANESSSVVRAYKLGLNRLTSLNLVPGRVTKSLSYGYGVVLYQSPGCLVENCTVSGHLRGGIAAFDSNDCVIRTNTIRDSVVRSGHGVTQADTGIDIYIAGSSSRNRVEGNLCTSGSGVGIAVQTLREHDRADRNVIHGNTVRNQPLYGIMLYVMHASASCRSNQIAHNLVDGISGDIPEANGHFNYGAGIYVQTAHGSIISSNTVRNTVTRSASGKPPFLNNVPAAIGISGVADCVVTENHIENAYYWGISVVLASIADPAGLIVIDRNRGRGMHRSGIYLLDVCDAQITGNEFRSAVPGEGQGILVRQATLRQSKSFLVRNNVIRDFGVGIEFDGNSIGRAVLERNVVVGNTGFSYALSADSVEVAGNVAHAALGGRGILVQPTVRSGRITQNEIAACGSIVVPTTLPTGIVERGNMRPNNLKC